MIQLILNGVNERSGRGSRLEDKHSVIPFSKPGDHSEFVQWLGSVCDQWDQQDLIELELVHEARHRI